MPIMHHSQYLPWVCFSSLFSLNQSVKDIYEIHAQKNSRNFWLYSWLKTRSQSAFECGKLKTESVKIASSRNSSPTFPSRNMLQNSSVSVISWQPAESKEKGKREVPPLIVNELLQFIIVWRNNSWHDWHQIEQGVDIVAIFSR